MNDRYLSSNENTDPNSHQLSAWSESRWKRLFDLTCTVPLTIVLLPCMLVVAVLVKLSSHGPILLYQQRCGKNARLFWLVKFRSMAASNSGPGLTRAGDARVTAIGRFLRAWKLDELPQLFNVLFGDMSLVGPRPDLPEYVSSLKTEERGILNLRPGVTGWATLCFRNEEELLASVPCNRLNEFYTTVVLPKKVRLDLEYGRRATFMTDVAVLLRTCERILRPAAQHPI